MYPLAPTPAPRSNAYAMRTSFVRDQYVYPSSRHDSADTNWAVFQANLRADAAPNTLFQVDQISTRRWKPPATWKYAGPVAPLHPVAHTVPTQIHNPYLDVMDLQNAFLHTTVPHQRGHTETFVPSRHARGAAAAVATPGSGEVAPAPPRGPMPAIGVFTRKGGACAGPARHAAPA